jgi:hypothetical protein
VPILAFNLEFDSTHMMFFAVSGGFKTTSTVVPTVNARKLSQRIGARAMRKPMAPSRESFFCLLRSADLRKSGMSYQDPPRTTRSVTEPPVNQTDPSTGALE